MTNLQLQECSIETCKPCDIVYILKDHVKAIIQLMSNELDEYFMQLITTKCLNTAVTMMYIYMGHQALHHTRFCDVPNVIQRYDNHVIAGSGYVQQRTLLAKSVHKSLLTSPKANGRFLHYIMLTDCVMESLHTDAKLYFPGHVFVIEQICNNGNSMYMIHQSYIQEYDLAGAIKKNNNSPYLGANIIKKLLNDFKEFCSGKEWNQRSIKFWKQLTHVGVEPYEGYSTEKIALCYQCVQVKSCAKIFMKLLQKHLHIIKDELDEYPAKKNSIYKETSSYTNLEKPFTYLEIQNEIETMISKTRNNLRITSGVDSNKIHSKQMNTHNNDHNNGQLIEKQIQKNGGSGSAIKHTDVSDKLPFIFLIDIDGTLVGDVSPLICSWEITKRQNPKMIHHIKKEIVYCLKRGIARPHTSTFLKHVSQTIPNAEFFIYTASDKKWANYLIPCLEQAVDFKFNRPIFSRPNCSNVGGEFRKSLKSILPTIVKTLNRKKRYRSLSTTDLYNNIALIDNQRVICEEELQKWIVCPTYAFKYTLDPLKYIPEDVLSNNLIEIIKLLQLYSFFPRFNYEKTFSLAGFKQIYYENLVKLTSKNTSLDSKVGMDDYFIKLESVIRSHKWTDLRKSVVGRINSSLQNTSTSNSTSNSNLVAR